MASPGPKVLKHTVYRINSVGPKDAQSVSQTLKLIGQMDLWNFQFDMSLKVVNLTQIYVTKWHH